MLWVPDGEHRARCVSHHLFGHAAHYQMSHKTATMRPHDDQVDVALPGVADDLDIRSTQPTRAQHIFCPQLILLLLGQDFPEQLARGVLVKFRCVRLAEVFLDDELALNNYLEIMAGLDVQQMELGVERPRQSDPYLAAASEVSLKSVGTRMRFRAIMVTLPLERSSIPRSSVKRC